jgi:hypothetical protein
MIPDKSFSKNIRVGFLIAVPGSPAVVKEIRGP